MASEEVDELFGQKGTGQPEPRTALVVFLLVFGLLATVFGMACTTAPGGILVLIAWVVIEREVDRIDSGFLPLDEKPRLLRLQRAVQGGLITVIVLFALQGVLFCYGFYEVFWGALFSYAFGA